MQLSLRSLDPSFGLLFHDLLKDLNVDSTGTSIIMSVLDAIVNFSGEYGVYDTTPDSNTMIVMYVTLLKDISSSTEIQEKKTLFPRRNVL